MKTLHYATTWQVSYKDAVKIKNGYRFLDLIKCFDFWPFEGEDYFEVSKEDFKNVIKALQNFENHYTQNDVAELLEALNLTAEQCADIMQKILQKSDTTDGYIHFSIF